MNESNYTMFAIKHYDNPQSVTKDDFESDLKRIRYVKRLLKRYKNTDNDLDDAMLRRIKRAILVPTGVPLSKQLLEGQKQL